MWSRRFLWTGLLSGFAIATIANAALWLVVFLYSGDKDPAWTVANITKFTIPGLIVYPATWCVVIFRARDYSLSRTMRLVVATFAAGTAVVGVVLMTGGLYVAISIIRAATMEGFAITDYRTFRICDHDCVRHHHSDRSIYDRCHPIGVTSSLVPFGGLCLFRPRICQHEIECSDCAVALKRRSVSTVSGRQLNGFAESPSGKFGFMTRRLQQAA